MFLPGKPSVMKSRQDTSSGIYSHQGPQVGDLNLWSKANPEEKFYTGKTRALHGTHLSTGDRLWSCFPFLRPMACITHDSLDWYGFDEDGASVHDVIGTRCDPYTAKIAFRNGLSSLLSFESDPGFF